MTLTDDVPDKLLACNKVIDDILAAEQIGSNAKIKLNQEHKQIEKK